MKRGAGLALAGLTAALAGLLAIASTERSATVVAPAPNAARPRLALLTSLPLMFGESFGLESVGSAALSRLEQRYEVVPIAVADAASLSGHKLLLMAHPRAQPAETLVELDRWVRRGGRVLLLADPKLNWHSERPLGDKLRPPPAFADTGLLGHWGLSLSGAHPDGPAEVGNGAIKTLASAPGRLSNRGDCKLFGDGFVARCRIGKGAATVIADADFLNIEGALDGPTDRNLALLIDELGRLESR